MEQLVRVLEFDSMDALAAELGQESEAMNHLQRLFSLAEAYGFRDWLVFDASVVRGLSYYTGVVFEAFDRAGEFRAICGGGRYDKLLETFGGEPLEAAGFGFGDAVIVELLKSRDLLPAFGSSDVQTVVFALSNDHYAGAVDVASTLRATGVAVDLVLESKKLKWVLKHANRIGARYLAIVAPDEWARGVIQMKDLVEGTQEEVSLSELSSWSAKNQAAAK